MTVSKKGLFYQLMEEKKSRLPAQRLVILHGVLGNLNNWKTVARNLKNDFDILIFDQRGHGRSEVKAGGFKYEDFQEDLKSLVDELGWDKFCILGHSMGARVGLVFSHTYPEKVEHLTMVDIGVKPYPFSFSHILDFVPTPFSSRKEARDFFQNEFTPRYGKFLSDFMYTNTRTIQVGEKDGVDWKLDKVSLEELVSQSEISLEKHLKELQAKLFLIRGGLSTSLLDEEFQYMLQSKPESRGYVIEQVGHFPHYEKQKEFTGLIRQELLSLLI